ncbi:MAG: hypothetical protein JOZ25_09325 [Actinobacteria bacterium]|nr:hypothetical protein [Actinomycetota bacterium]
MTRRLVLPIALALVAVAPASAAAAKTEKNPAGHLRGLVHARREASRWRFGSNNLTYHNGPVMHTNQVYAIFWDPSGSINPAYESTIGRFFTDVAADSQNGTTPAKTTNVYYSDTQYYDNSKTHILYSSVFASSQAYVDTHPFPANGCTDSYTSTCLSDAQIQSEVGSLIRSKGWPTGNGAIYFVFTPKGVGSCAGSSCAFSYYCAYHSNFTSNGSQVLYANMPYANTVPSACGSGQSPNGPGGAGDADSTLSVTSHEHNESITDPLGTAWFDRYGNENGDKCAWNFGTALGSTSSSSPGTTKYNQRINNDPYYLQQEWSNARSGCVLTGT